MTKHLIWPLYHIRPYRKIWEEDNIIYLDTDYNEFIIDNKNLSGKTLGLRRIQLENTLLEELKIYKLRKIFYSISDIIKHKTPSRTYIDSSGQLFFYGKRNKRNLIYKKVIRTVVHENRVLCYCKDIHRPIELAFIPAVMPKYLGLLQIWGDYQLYELSAEAKKDTWRLI